MNTSAYADTAVRESPFFYYIYKKSFVYPYTHRKTKYIIFFVLCEQEKVPLIPFLVCMTTKKAAYTPNFLLKTINEQIQNIAQKKDTLCRRMYN